jgi:pimeloyl-ACP methyl ester carboxylesterase
LKKLQYYLLTKSIGLYINILALFAPKKAGVLAWKLFSNPRKGKIKDSKYPKTLLHAEKEILKYKEHSIQTYIWKGSEEVIMLVHGWESNASRWKKMLVHLKELGKTIVAIDAPAHGLSSGLEFNVPLYTEFLEVCVQHYKPNYLIGHSIGGATCVFHQKKYPNTSIKKMVLLGAPAELQIIFKNYAQLISLSKKGKKEFYRYFENTFQINSDDFSGEIYAESIPIPTLIAHDTKDAVVLFEESKKYEKGFKNNKYITTNNLGHSLHDAELYQQINQFLTED